MDKQDPQILAETLKLLDRVVLLMMVMMFAVASVMVVLLVVVVLVVVVVVVVLMVEPEFVLLSLCITWFFYLWKIVPLVLCLQEMQGLGHSNHV